MICRLNNFLDKLDIVKILRVVAVLILLVGVFTLVMSMLPHFKGVSSNPTLKNFFGISTMMGIQLVRIMFEPVVLLALAEIVKHKQEKK